MTVEQSYVVGFDVTGDMTGALEGCEGTSFVGAEAYAEVRRTTSGDVATWVRLAFPGFSKPLNISGVGTRILKITGFIATDIAPFLEKGAVVNVASCSGYDTGPFGQILQADKTPNAGVQPIRVR